MYPLNLLTFVLIICVWNDSAFAGTPTVSESSKDSLYSGQISYSVSTDFADNLNPRLYYHFLSFGGERSIPGWFTLSAQLAAQYLSLGGAIGTGTQPSGNLGPGFSDAFLGVSRKLHQWELLGGTHNLSFGLGNYLPLSERSRMEGYKSIPQASLIFRSTFLDDRYTLTNTASWMYVINTFSDSQITNSPNPTSSFSYNLSNKFTLLPNFDLDIRFGVKFARFTDGFQNYSYMNQEKLTYAYKHFSFDLAYQNGGYTDDGRLNLWFIDQYRRVVTGGISYEF